MTKSILTAVTRTQGNNRDLKSGAVTSSRVDLNFIEVPVLIHAFRRMVRNLEFDVCEMALTTYLCAREHGKPFTALPVFLVRGFHHGAILVNRQAGIRHPKDLEGKRVGVNRGYTVTTGVWARGLLQQEYGVDLGRVTWVLSGDEHVAEYRAPDNVVPIEPGKDMAEMLVSGELAAAIGVQVDHPEVVPLIADADQRGLDALRDRAYYPINHLIVVKDELLAGDAGLAAELFELFAESKRRYVDCLTNGGIDDPTSVDRMHQRVMEITGDPLPYGVGPNRHMLEELAGHARDQGIIKQPMAVETMFARGTHHLVG